MSYNANGDLTKATLAYIPIVGIILYILEKEDNYVRYHSMQSILLTVVGVILGILLAIIGAIFAPTYSVYGYVYNLGVTSPIVWILQLIVWLGFAAVIIYSMIQAYKGVWHKLPIIGEMALKITSK